MMGDDVENLIEMEVRTLSDEEAMYVWAAENKINKEALDKLVKDGFTSMDALRLVDQEDLHKSKLPRGQQKLILACVQKYNAAHAQAEQAQPCDMTIQMEAGLLRDVTMSRRENPQSQQRLAGQHVDAAQTQGATQVTSLAGGNGIEQHGVQTPMNPGSETVDPYVAAVLQQFQSGQAQARVAGAERLPNNDLLGGLGILPQNVTHVNSGETHTPPTNANSNSASPSVGNNTLFSNQQC